MISKRANEFVDLTGMKFGRWTVVSRGLTVNKKVKWNCICECGNLGSVCTQNLKGELSTSCGCYKLGRMVTHGMTGSTEYRIWQFMRDRCSNTKNSHYHLYGGRGITVCERWKTDFSAFLEDMGRRPRGTSIDRIDNDGNYEPGNCRWATIVEQNRNKRNNRFIEAMGKRQTMKEWSLELGKSVGCLDYHLSRGKTMEQIAMRLNSRG